MKDPSRDGIKLQTRTVMKLRDSEIGCKSKAVQLNQIVRPTIQLLLKLQQLGLKLSWSLIQISQENMSINKPYLDHFNFLIFPPWKGVDEKMVQAALPGSILPHLLTTLLTLGSPPTPLYSCHQYWSRLLHLWVFLSQKLPNLVSSPLGSALGSCAHSPTTTQISLLPAFPDPTQKQSVPDTDAPWHSATPSNTSYWLALHIHLCLPRAQTVKGRKSLCFTNMSNRVSTKIDPQ